jgi:hypothetical protein
MRRILTVYSDDTDSTGNAGGKGKGKHGKVN